MLIQRICGFLFVFCFSSLEAVIDGEPYQILRVLPQTNEHMRVLRSMEKELGFEADYLQEVRSVGRPGDLIVSDTDFNKTIKYLKKHGVDNKLLVDGMAQMAHRDRRSLMTDIQGPVTLEHISNHYISYNDQLRFLDQLAASNSAFIRSEVIAKSWEGRTVKSITFGYPTAPNKPILWINSGIHAREWIAPSTALYAMWQLANDPKWQNLLTRIDITIAPNVNPDGYEFSRTSRRLWRKTRSRLTVGSCLGVDANRNFPFHWGEAGVSRQTCSEIYCGTEPMSEPEIKGVASAMYAKKDRIKAFIDLHSYGQNILYPWGYVVNTYPPDKDELIAMAEFMSKAISSVSGTEYEVANSADGLYPAAGAGDDWAKSLGIKYSYTIELSPRTAYYGFELPENFIESVAKEVFAGLAVLGERIANEYPVRTFVANRSSVRKVVARPRHRTRTRVKPVQRRPFAPVNGQQRPPTLVGPAKFRNVGRGG